MRVDSLIEKVSGDKTEPSSEDIQEYYNENTSLFMTAEEVRSFHIFKSLQQAENKEILFQEMRKVRNMAKEEMILWSSFVNTVTNLRKKLI